mgnify:FL=1
MSPEAISQQKLSLETDLKYDDNHLISAAYFPENSIAAFQEAINQGAHALECDIHVSKDNKAMVIHGNTLLPYAFYIGEENEAKNKAKNKEKDSTLVSKFSQKDLQSKFILKDFDLVNIKDRDKSGSEINDLLMSKSFKDKEELLKNKNRYTIPTLTELLNLVKDANKNKRTKDKDEDEDEDEDAQLLTLNIELKGYNSAIASFKSIMDFYAENTENATYLPSDCLVFLGRLDMNEIAVMNSLIKHGQNPTETKLDLGQKELEAYYLLTQREEIKYYIDVKNNLEDIIKQKLTDSQKSTDETPEKYTILPGYPDRQVENVISEHYPGLDLETFKEKLKNINNITEELNKQTAISQHPINKLPQSDLEQKENGLIPKFTDEQLDYYLITSKFHKNFNKLKYNSFFQSLFPKTNQSQINFAMLSNAKTNVMIGTGELFGKDAIYKDNEDFDVIPGTKSITPYCKEMLSFIIKESAHNGIDISLYDMAESIIKYLSNLYSQNKSVVPFMGFTASNWKCSKKEKSPVSLLSSIQRAFRIQDKINIPFLLKTDEPGLFKYYVDVIELMKEKHKPVNQLSETTLDTKPSSLPLYMRSRTLGAPCLSKESFAEKNLLEESTDNEEEVMALTSSCLTPGVKPPRTPVKRNSPISEKATSPFSLSPL